MKDSGEKTEGRGGGQEDPVPASRIFGERADRYAELDVFSEEQFYRPLLDLAAPAAGERVLDLAAGTGLLTLMLARGGAVVTAADVTPEMLDLARERLAAAGCDNVSFEVAGVPSLPFASGSFDLVTCRLAFHHFTDPAEALRDIHRVLKPGGRFVMEDVFGPGADDKQRRPVRERLEKLFDPSHVRAYAQDELRSLLKEAGFRIAAEEEPHTKGLPVGFVLKLERVEDPADRDEIVRLLKENLDQDLVGFTAFEEGGELTLQWKTVIIAAARD